MKKKMKYLVLSAALFISVATFAQKEELKSLKKIYAKEKPTTKDVESYKTALQSLESVASSEEEKVYKNFYKGMFPLIELASLGEKVTPADQMKLFNEENLKNFITAVNETKAYESKLTKKEYTADIDETLSWFSPMLQNMSYEMIKANQPKKASELFYLRYLLNKNDGLSLENSARLAHQAQDYILSEKLFDEFVASDYFKTGIIYYATNVASGNEEVFPNKISRTQALTLKTHIKPRDEKVNANAYEIYRILAELTDYNGNNEKAEKYFNLALDSNPKDLDVLKSVSRFYLQKGYNLIKKEEIIIKELNDGATSAKRKEELLLERKAMFKEALPHFEKSYELDNTNTNSKEVLKATYEILEMKDKASKL